MEAWRDVGARIARLSVEAPDGCILWTGAIDDSGYGRMSFCGRNSRATRLAWSAFHQRPFPRGKFALHGCDTRSCVNPLHLHLGDNSQNMKEMWERNEGIKPTRCPKGHEYTPDNMAKLGGVKRYACKVCRRQTKRLARLAKRARGDAK